MSGELVVTPKARLDRLEGRVGDLEQLVAQIAEVLDRTMGLAETDEIAERARIYRERLRGGRRG